MVEEAVDLRSAEERAHESKSGFGTLKRNHGVCESVLFFSAHKQPMAPILPRCKSAALSGTLHFDTAGESKVGGAGQAHVGEFVAVTVELDLQHVTSLDLHFDR